MWGLLAFVDTVGSQEGALWIYFGAFVFFLLALGLVLAVGEAAKARATLENKEHSLL